MLNDYHKNNISLGRNLLHRNLYLKKWEVPGAIYVCPIIQYYISLMNTFNFKLFWMCKHMFSVLWFSRCTYILLRTAINNTCFWFFRHKANNILFCLTSYVCRWRRNGLHKSSVHYFSIQVIVCLENVFASHIIYYILNTVKILSKKVHFLYIHLIDISYVIYILLYSLNGNRDTFVIIFYNLIYRRSKI
jgi:hypothetical protein